MFRGLVTAKPHGGNYIKVRPLVHQLLCNHLFLESEAVQHCAMWSVTGLVVPRIAWLDGLVASV